MQNSIPHFMFFDDNKLGKIVRDAWITWAMEQPNPKPSWLVPYEELSQADKDADIRIGRAVEAACNNAIDKVLIIHNNQDKPIKMVYETNIIDEPSCEDYLKLIDKIKAQ